MAEARLDARRRARPDDDDPRFVAQILLRGTALRSPPSRRSSPRRPRPAAERYGPQPPDPPAGSSRERSSRSRSLDSFRVRRGGSEYRHRAAPDHHRGRVRGGRDRPGVAAREPGQGAGRVQPARGGRGQARLRSQPFPPRGGADRRDVDRLAVERLWRGDAVRERQGLPGRARLGQGAGRRHRHHRGHPHHLLRHPSSWASWRPSGSACSGPRRPRCSSPRR